MALSPVTDPVKEGAMDAVQEKLTGPMRPEAAARQVAQEKAAQQKSMDLLWKRLEQELGDEQVDLLFDPAESSRTKIEDILISILEGMTNPSESLPAVARKTRVPTSTSPGNMESVLLQALRSLEDSGVGPRMGPVESRVANQPLSLRELMIRGPRNVDQLLGK